jgi:TetR/AcrR family transcriptional regulator, cholesterol catabolism regulator
MATRTPKAAPAATRTSRPRSGTPRRRAPAPKTALEELRGDVLQIKRERILREAAALFYEGGYTQTTMEAIADRMGATKPFVYYHFDSKAVMLVEICERATADALAAVDEVLRRPAAPIARLEAFLRAFTQAALKNHEFVAIYFREEFSLPEDARARINAMRKSIDRKLREVLADGVASGDFAIDDPGVTALVLEGMSSYAFAWYRDAGRLDLAQVTELIVRMAMRTVLARPRSVAGPQSTLQPRSAPPPVNSAERWG